MDTIEKELSGVKMMFFPGTDGPAYAEDFLKLMGFCSSSAPPVALKETDYAAIYLTRRNGLRTDMHQSPLLQQIMFHIHFSAVNGIQKILETAKGEVGELIVHGPGVMLCYYKNPEATDEVLKDRWLYTGDMARMDEDGFIYLVDRKKDVIISGGENLYPVQIEDYLRRNDKIKDVAVIGLPDARLGEIAAAIIELKENVSCTEEEIMDFSAQVAAIPYFQPNCPAYPTNTTAEK